MIKHFVFASLLNFILVSVLLAGTGISKLQRFLAEVDTLSAQYEQSVLDLENGTTGRFQGTLYISRPGKFLWDYTEPTIKQILADGDTVYIIDDELEQITYVSQERALKGTPASVLINKGRLEDRFELIDLGNSQQMDWVELIPRDPESQFVRVLLAFMGDDLRRLEMTDQLGQVTRFQFYNVERNPALQADLFKFKQRSGFDFLDDI